MDRTVREISIMTDRTKIADALERMAVEAEDGYSIPAGPSEVTTFRDAARLLRADPDTDRRNILPGEHAKPDGTWCPYLAPSNEAGVWVCMKCGNSGGVSTPDTDPNTLADRLDNGWMLTNSEMRAAADGLRQLADEHRALREQLDAAQLRSIEASNPGIDMDEVRQVRLAYPDPERHETVSRAKYGASLASDIAADGGAAVAEGAEDAEDTE